MCLNEEQAVVRLIDTLNRKGAVAALSLRTIRQMSQRRLRARLDRWRKRQSQQQGDHSARNLVMEERLAHWNSLSPNEREDFLDKEFHQMDEEHGKQNEPEKKKHCAARHW